MTSRKMASLTHTHTEHVENWGALLVTYCTAEPADRIRARGYMQTGSFNYSLAAPRSPELLFHGFARFPATGSGLLGPVLGAGM